MIAGVEFGAQDLQDMFAYLYCKGKRDGFFVDIGAYDGITISNTYALEKMGWTGICVEPIPEIYDELTRNRACTCVSAAIYDDEKEQAFIQTTRGRSGIIDNMSKGLRNAAEAEGVVKTLSIRPVTFGQLMSNCDIDYIDFLSIDVEGSELGVLKSIDFKRYKFGLITVENNSGARLLKAFMSGRGYKALLELGVDVLFVPRDVEIGMWWTDP